MTKATKHNGRGYAKHNDRTQTKEQPKNIDVALTPQNVYSSYVQNQTDTPNFYAEELAFYTDKFSKAIDETNLKYVANGHSEKVKTVEQWMDSRGHQPRETILQVGNVSDTISPEKLQKVNAEYQQLYQREIKHRQATHGTAADVFTLNSAQHNDEATPHVHVREVFMFTRDDGCMDVGQDGALEALGYGLPDPTKPKGRYNNIVQTFDTEMRNLWLDVCESNGIKVERLPERTDNGKPLKTYEERRDFVRNKQESEISLNTEMISQQRGEMGVLRKMKDVDVSKMVEISKGVEKQSAKLVTLDASIKDKLTALEELDAFKALPAVIVPVELRAEEWLKTHNLTKDGKSISMYDAMMQGLQKLSSDMSQEQLSERNRKRTADLTSKFGHLRNSPEETEREL